MAPVTLIVLTILAVAALTLAVWLVVRSRRRRRMRARFMRALKSVYTPEILKRMFNPDRVSPLLKALDRGANDQLCENGKQ